jgi:hypothetical protein
LVWGLNVLPIPIIQVAGKFREQLPAAKLLIYAETCDDFCLQSLLDAGIRGCVLKEEPVDELVMAIQVIANGGTYFSRLALNELAQHAGEKMSMLNNRKILSFSTLIVFIMTGLLFSCNRQTISEQIVGESSLRVTETAIFIDKPISSPTIIAPSESPPLSTPTASATSTQPPSAPATPSATATSLFTTVTPLEEWLVYENDFYSYQFSYPPEANIGIEGVIDYPSDEKPENLSDDAFLDQLKETYPGDICVVITYMTGFVTIRAPLDNGGRYTSHCGTSGVGADYDVVEKTEVVMVNGEQYTSEGVELYRAADETRVVRELFYIYLPDGTQIHYGRAVGFPDEGEVKEVLMQIISSYHR